MKPFIIFSRWGLNINSFPLKINKMLSLYVFIQIKLNNNVTPRWIPTVGRPIETCFRVENVFFFFDFAVMLIAIL